MSRRLIPLIVLLAVLPTACGPAEVPSGGAGPVTRIAVVPSGTDLATLTARERTMLAHLQDAVAAIDDVYWMQVWGERRARLETIADPGLLRRVELNYGPWDRLAADAPLVPDLGPRPPGLNLYPPGLTREAFDEAATVDPSLLDPFAAVRLDAVGQLVSEPYSITFADPIELAATNLWAASRVADDPTVARYLDSVALGLTVDDHEPGDLAWLELPGTGLEIALGLLEGDDRLAGVKRTFGAWLLLGAEAESLRLADYIARIPAAHAGGPGDAPHPAVVRATAADLLARAGAANTGPGDLVLDLPIDGAVRRQHGSRRVVLCNLATAHLEQLVRPLSDLLIAPDQRALVTAEAFVDNLLLEEAAAVADPVPWPAGTEVPDDARSRAIEWLATRLHAPAFLAVLADPDGETPGLVAGHGVTYVAGLLDAVRRDASGTRGQAAAMALAFLQAEGVLKRDPSAGTWTVDADPLIGAARTMGERGRKILLGGDTNEAAAWATRGVALQVAIADDLVRLGGDNLPLRVVLGPPAGVDEAGPEVPPVGR